MNGLKILGDYIVEIFVVTLLLAVSAVSVVLFVPMLVGVVGFFKQARNVRRFKDIFTTIGKNIKIIVIYTLFQLIIIIFPTLNLYFFNTHPLNINYFVTAVCWIALVVGIVYLVNAPVIIVNMEVGFGQLLYNGIMLLFGGPVRSLVCLAAAGGVVAIIMYYPYVLPLVLYPLPLVISKLVGENILRLKAKALGTSVGEMLRSENKDDYLNEYGEVDHSEDGK